MSHPHPGSELATHVPDVVWLVGLWLAIHGGDPSPEAQDVSDEKVTAALSSMTNALSHGALSGAQGTLHADQLKKLGVTVYEQAADDGLAPRFCIISGWSAPICFRGPPALK